MLIVGIELDMLSQWKKTTNKFGCGAPFSVLACVVGLEGNIGYGMVGMERNRSFEGEFIAIAPGELAVLPVEVGAISVSNQKSCFHRKVKGCRRQEAVVLGLLRSSDVS